jgi:hypothetical protein
MTDPRDPFTGPAPHVYRLTPQRDMRRTACAFGLAMLFGAAFWAILYAVAFGAIEMPGNLTAPTEAPMPKPRGK